MKKHIISLLVILFSISLNAQTNFELYWELSLGGSDNESAMAVCRTNIGNYFVVGSSRSVDGQVVGNHGSWDYWAVKTGEGNLLGQLPLGGTEIDRCFDGKQTLDEGFVLVGSSTSDDGQVTGNHGGSDIWVVKLTPGGNIDWQKCLGGSDAEEGSSIEITADDGYIVAGSTVSNDGDVSGNHGGSDFWLVKLNSLGDIQWQKCYGGTDWDNCKVVKQTVDDGYILAGYTLSNDGDVSGNNGSADYWVIKVDETGNTEWQKCLGGSLYDEANDILEVADGYLVLGSAISNDGDVTGNHGNTDYWLVKLNNTGEIVWSKCYGGSGYDDGEAITEINDGVVLTGATNSVDGDITLHIGGYDYWTAIVDDSDGDLIWQMSLGGQLDDGAYGVTPTDMGFLIVGYSYSNDGHVSGNHGGSDYWLARMALTENVDDNNADDINMFPIPVDDGVLTITGSKLLSVEIFSITGSTVLSSVIPQSTNNIDVSSLIEGLYFARINTEQGVVVKKLIVK